MKTQFFDHVDSIYRHRVDYWITIVSFYYWFNLFVEHTCIFSWNLKKDYFTSTSCGALYGLETNLVSIVLAQFYPSMAIIQPPQHSMILIIQGATDYPCLEDCHGTNYKIFLLYCYYKFFNLWNNILPMVWVY